MYGCSEEIDEESAAAADSERPCLILRVTGPRGEAARGKGEKEERKREIGMG